MNYEGMFRVGLPRGLWGIDRDDMEEILVRLSLSGDFDTDMKTATSGTPQGPPAWPPILPSTAQP